MMTTIVSIGNSKGIRIPKLLLEESGLGKKVELRVKRGEIKIIPFKKKKPISSLLASASEAAFAKDWLRPEEDAAWKVYQLGK